MSCKSILVHIDDTNRCAERVWLACNLARRFDAHLYGAAETGVARYIYQSGDMNGIDPTLLSQIDHLRERAVANVAEFKRLAAACGVTSFDGDVTQDDAVGGFGYYARYSDLVVVGQTNPDEPSPTTLSDLPEYLILHAGRPVLIVPFAGKFAEAGDVGRHPIIAWDSSRAAARAVADALPLLQSAGSAHIVIINPERGEHDDNPGAALATWLGRHGVEADIALHRTKLDVTNTLLSLATDRDADLIVMGGYGHSRLRELVMGGATRAMLQHMTVPVLMSH